MSKASIEQILTQSLSPTLIQVVDESHAHAGHNEDAKKGSTHFRVIIVSNVFEGKKLIERHRMIYELLKDQHVSYHALAITAKTQAEYSA